jgi:hypothetical protein
VAPDGEAAKPYPESEDEGNSPAVGHDRLGRHHGVHDRARGRAEQRARRRPDWAPASHPPPPSWLRAFNQEDGRRHVLAADRETLEQPEPEEQDRRRQANGRSAGEDTDEKRGERHRQYRPDQRLLATEAVADPAEQRTTDRSHHEAGGEGAERRQQ